MVLAQHTLMVGHRTGVQRLGRHRKTDCHSHTN
jgi:hypothetical protein